MYISLSLSIYIYIYRVVVEGCSSQICQFYRHYIMSETNKLALYYEWHYEWNSAVHLTPSQGPLIIKHSVTHNTAEIHS